MINQCILIFRNKFIEKELHENCIEKLELTMLTKDDSVDPDRMIDCLKRLLDADIRLNNCNLHITHYYSVLSDGTMCIPWDWKFEWNCTPQLHLIEFMLYYILLYIEFIHTNQCETNLWTDSWNLMLAHQNVHNTYDWYYLTSTTSNVLFNF